MKHLRACSMLAAMSFAAHQAQAIDLTAGDWKFTANGNINVHYIYSSCDDETTAPVAGGLACIGAAGEDHASSISNGLLPAALVFGVSTTQAGYDIGVTFGLFPGISTNDGGSPNLGGGTNTALGTTGLDIRKVFMTIGFSGGTVTAGRDFGLFGFDAINNDMTINGVGAGNGNYAAPVNTSLGSIGLGYIYADTLAQINYTTPDIGGAKFTIGVFDPVEPILQGTATPKAEPGVHGKVAYTHGPLYLSATFLTQKQRDASARTYNSRAFDAGGILKAGPVQLLGYYYSGKGVGTTGLYLFAADSNAKPRDSDGFLAQVTWTLGQTKLGANYGVSNLDLATGEASSALVEKNSKYTLGVYQALTPNLTVLGELSKVEAEAHNGIDNDSSSINVGAFLSF